MFNYSKVKIKLFMITLFFMILYASLPVFANDAGGSFSQGPDMQVNRMAHYSILLPNGKVLLIGGHGTNFVALNSAEIFDPNTNQFTLLTMNSPRDLPAVAKLQDGRYLIAGGAYDWGVAPGYNTAEIFNPTNNTFTNVGNLNYGRSNCRAATLTNGKVLIVGGWYSNDAGTYGEIFNPDTNSFTLTGALNTPRSWPYVIPVANNRALVLGGGGVYGGSEIERVELYDYVTNSFTILKETLFDGESGWRVQNYGQYMKIIDDFRLWNGKYLLFASRTVGNVTEHTLFNVDPATLQITKLNINLPDTEDDLASLILIGIDNNKKKAYLLGHLDATPPPSTLRLYTVDLVNMTINNPTGSYTVTPEDYYVSSSSSSILLDGRIFITGGTSRIDYYYNFYPVKYTLLITPNPASEQKSILLYENFEDRVLDRKISVATTGTFSFLPGIKDIAQFGSTKAFGFGRSTCTYNCWGGYITTLKINFGVPTYVSVISFKEMELYDNWGSGGKIFIDGQPLTGGDFWDPQYHDFGRLPYNDHISDTTKYRTKYFSVNKFVTVVELKVWDITRLSEIFIDDLVIYGAAKEPIRLIQPNSGRK